ncbi:GNAT family N-acetyltransferase [Sporichthya sp.]|uniref:GNAT family N-acetyltransferase n=1 Tax=Sporichthya sp. TaxID=65475 RepID=UPI0017AE0C49|nr:GNAT family N-acetyltransferase [Sporichthya sp.]MBA3744069.1 GNAT family N-acetyltransferase [Sporichthya sp.]
MTMAEQTTLVLTPTPYDDPVSAALIEAVQRVYVVRYGGRDATLVEPTDFAPPRGLFLVGRLSGEPIACGGWRIVEPGLAELKRMYVASGFRGRGLSRILLAALEDSARGLGITRLRLETGHRQPEAIRLYETSGYSVVEKFGVYRNDPGSTCFGKTLV